MVVRHSQAIIDAMMLVLTVMIINISVEVV